MMKIPLFVVILAFLLFPASTQPTATVDKQQISSILSNATADLVFLDQVGEKSNLDLAFILDRKASHQRLEELSRRRQKLDTASPQDIDEVVLLSNSLRFARHLSAQKSAFQANPNSNGMQVVTAHLSWNQKPAIGWRVGFLGENDLPYGVTPGDRVDEVCAKKIALPTVGESPQVAKQEPPPPGTVEVQVVVGSVYLWVKHPDNCSPRSEVHQFVDPRSVDLTAPGEKP